MREILQEFTSTFWKVVRVGMALFVVGLAFLVVSKENGHALVVVGAILITATIVLALLWFILVLVFDWATGRIAGRSQPDDEEPPI